MLHFFGALQLLAMFAIKFQNALIVDVNCFLALLKVYPLLIN